jgi:hypothetical protein
MKQLRKLLMVGLFGIGLLVSTAAPAHATLIVGNFGFTTGDVQVTNFGTGNIDWNPPSNPPPNGATATYGNFSIGPTITGVFALPPFTVCPPNCAQGEQIHDMSQSPAESGNFTPVGAHTTTNFFIFAEHPTWVFNETFLASGDLGPFTFTEQLTPQGIATTVGITLSGFAFDPATPSQISQWVATISTQYLGNTDSVISGFINNTLTNQTWSGFFSATAPSGIPEPTTLVLLGTGLIGVGMRARRRLQKK